jgi:hypothetical protein
MNRVARRRRMFSLVELYKTVNESRSDFCKRHRLPLATFGWWQHQYRLSRKKREEGTTPAAPSFVRLLPSTPVLAGVFELSLPDGCTVRFPAGVSCDEFLRLVARLRGSASCSA